MALEAAQEANVWFLAIVASWRVALLVVFLIRFASLSIFQAVVATLLPITLIVTTLFLLNLEHVVFRIMAGLEDHERSVNDAAYGILFLITFFSVLAFPFIVLIYGGLIYWIRNPGGTQKAEQAQPRG